MRPNVPKLIFAVLLSVYFLWIAWDPMQGSFLDNVDLLICEASYTREREPEGIQHLSARQAGELARRSQVGQLVLTHQLPGADVDAHALEGADAFGRPVSVAHEHVVYTV